MRSFALVAFLAISANAFAQGGATYNFDFVSGSTVPDVSGAGNSASIVGAALVDGHDGHGAKFSSAADYVAVPQAVFAGWSNTAYFEAWVKPAAYPQSGCLGTIMRKRAPFNDWELDLQSDGSLFSSLWDISHTDAVGTHGGSLPLGVWSKVATEYDGSTLRIFINGVSVASATKTVIPDWTGGYIGTEIGNDSYDTGVNCPDYVFRGVIDDVVIARSRTSAPPPSTTLLFEGFSNGIPAGWSPYCGSFSVSDGVANLSYGTLVVPGSFDRSRGLRIEADVNITWGGAGDFDYFVFYNPNNPGPPECHHPTNGYEFGYFPVGSDNPNDWWFETENGQANQMRQVPTRITANAWTHVTAELLPDGTIRSLINGVPIIQATSGRWSSGPIVLRSWGAVLIDNVRVSTLATESQSSQPHIYSVTPSTLTGGTTVDLVVFGDNLAPNAAVSVTSEFAPLESNEITINSHTVVSSTQINLNVSVADYALPNRYITKVVSADQEATFNGPSVRRRAVIIVPGTLGSYLKNDSDDVIWLSAFHLRCETLLQMALQADGESPATEEINLNLDGNLCSGRGRSLHPDGAFSSGLVNFYGPVEQALRAQGLNVQEFSYDWRLDMRTNAFRLRQMIERLAETSRDRVDLVVHSQGGLLARTYETLFHADPRLTTVVYLSVPELGTPKAYVATHGWADFESFYEPLVGTGNVGIMPHGVATFMAANFAAFHQMMPRFDFVLPAGRSLAAEPFATTYSREAALESLPNIIAGGDLAADAQALWRTWDTTPAGVRPFSINGSGFNTLLGLWRRGDCIHPLNDPRGDGLVIYEGGAAGFPGGPQYYINEKHADVPTNGSVINAVGDVLASGRLVTAQLQASPSVAGRFLQSVVCSPVELSLRDSQGRQVGISDGVLQRGIPNSDFYIFPENEAASASFEEPVTSHLKSKGNGTFSLFVTAIDPAQQTEDNFAFTDIPISIKSVADVQSVPFTEPTLNLDIDGDGTPDFSVVANKPVTPRVFPAVLHSVVASYGLHNGTSEDLNATISAIDRSLQRGGTESPCGQYKALRNKIAALVGGKLTQKEHDELLQIIAKGELVIPCPKN